jgi:hypothetical protein
VGRKSPPAPPPKEADPPEPADSDEPEEEVSRKGSHWITKNEAIDYLGLTPRSFSRREQAGDFKAQFVPGMGHRYDRRELERLSGDQSAMQQLSRLLQVTRDMLATSNEHNRAMMGMMQGPQKVWVDAIQEENKSLREQLGLLRTKYEGALDTIEKARSEVLERELQATRAAHSEARKEQAWKLALKMLPKLGEQMAGTHRIAKFIRELGQEELDALTDPKVGFLTPEQCEVLRDAVKRFRSADTMSTEIDDKKTNGKAAADGDVVMPREGGAPAS